MSLSCENVFTMLSLRGVKRRSNPVEQLWLGYGYVMKEKFKKAWNEKDWI